MNFHHGCAFLIAGACLFEKLRGLVEAGKITQQILLALMHSPEPSSVQQDLPKIAVVLINVGTPDAATLAASRHFLKEYLRDARINEESAFTRWLSRNFMAVFFRSMKLAKRHAAIWKREGSPLLVNTEKQAKKLARHLQTREHDVHVTYAMRYGNPSISKTLDALQQSGYDRILVLPVYPQYCDATTGAAWDAVAQHYIGQRSMPELRFVRDFHDHEDYIEALAELVRNFWETHERPDKLVMSFRGIQKERNERAEAYVTRCNRSATLLAERLGLLKEQYQVVFQSCLGPGERVEPQVTAALEKLAREKAGRVDVVFPSFATDSVDTLGEIDMEARQRFVGAGGKDLRVIPCLNDSEPWLQALAGITEQHLLGWPTMQNKTEVGQLGSSKKVMGR